MRDPLPSSPFGPPALSCWSLYPDPDVIMPRGLRTGREHEGLFQAAGQSAGRWLAGFAPPPALAPPRCSARIGAASCLSPHWGGGVRLRSLCRGLRAPRLPELPVVWARAPRPREQSWPETAALWVSRGRTRGSGSGSDALSP